MQTFNLYEFIIPNINMLYYYLLYYWQRFLSFNILKSLNFKDLPIVFNIPNLDGATSRRKSTTDVHDVLLHVQAGFTRWPRDSVHDFLLYVQFVWVYYGAWTTLLSPLLWAQKKKIHVLIYEKKNLKWFWNNILDVYWVWGPIDPRPWWYSYGRHYRNTLQSFNIFYIFKTINRTKYYFEWLKKII